MPIERAFLVAMLAVVVTGAIACDVDRRCLSGALPAHCEGNTVVQCVSGPMSFIPSVFREDCGQLTTGPGKCQSALHEGRPMAWCEPP